MTKTLSRSVRYLFATLVLVLTAYTLLESAMGARPAAAAVAEREGLSTCGTQDAPCRLDAVTVRAEQTHRTQLAAGARAPQMTLRVRS